MTSKHRRIPPHASSAAAEDGWTVPRHRFTDLREIPVSLRLGSHRAEVLYWGFFEPRYWRNYLHAHSFYEICYDYAGRGAFRIQGGEQRVKAGDAFVARPGEPHEIVSARGRDALGIYFWAYTLVPATSSPGRDRPSRDRPSPAPARDATDALLEAFATTTRAVSADVPGMEATLRLLTEEAVRKRPGYTHAVTALVSKLLLDTARAVAPADLPAETVEAPAGSEAAAAVRTALRYLGDNFARPIGLRDVAAQVHLSERHLGRLFRQETGRSVLDHLTGIRLDAARQLLLERDTPIKQVARAVGYPDVRYFTTLFGRRAGLTPAAFRATRGTRHLPPRRG